MRKQVLWTLFFIVICLISIYTYVMFYTSQVQISSHCNPDNGSSKCSIDIVSGTHLLRPWNWRIALQPSNIHLGVSSGTLTPGGRNEIQFRVSHEQCPATVVFTGSDGTVIKSGLTGC